MLMPPLLPLIGLAALAVAGARFARREMTRVTRMLDERDQTSGSLARQKAPVLRRDPADGRWRVDSPSIDDRR
jgi:hypothetical protein